MPLTPPSPRPRLTATILVFAVVDMLGMVAFATGVLWLAQGETLFIPGFPRNVPEAVLSTVVGVGLMLWAAARILRELIKGKKPVAATGKSDK